MEFHQGSYLCRVPFMRNSLFYVLLLLVLVSAMSSCTKDDILADSSAKLEFSQDTVLFDTVFVSLGSTTKQLIIHNRNNGKLRISSIRLAGGSASHFRLNLDGIPGDVFTDIEIPAKDSLYMFIEVTVDPNQATTPYLVLDSILFTTNGNLQDVDLVAFGQNAHFIVADSVLLTGSGKIHYALLDPNLNAQIHWDNTLPYVVYGGYAVVDSTQTLTIDAGTKVYFGNNSGLWVYRYGTLKVNGTKDLPVNFQGVRLESYYQDIPGQWDRIWINEGSDQNEINYAVIRNGFIGLQTEPLFDTVPPKKLKLYNTVIQNMSGFGILSRYYNIEAANDVIDRAGQYLVALVNGGGYSFTHCTLANYWNASQRSTPSLYMNDYALDQSSNPVHYPLYQAEFNNCIVWGNNDEELEIDYQFGTMVHQFNNVLLRTQTNVAAPNFVSMILNQNPLFVDYTENDYHLDSGSPAIDAGDPAFATGVSVNDIEENPRGTAPDLGAFEKQ